jgi:hypothetical protein
MKQYVSVDRLNAYMVAPLFPAPAGAGYCGVNQPTEAKTMANIQIYRDDIWVGSGTIDIDGEIECSAALGPDQDASDETYCKIMDAIDNEPQDEARYTGRGSIERPDGTYSWIISD